jgi:hypothetical protein
VSDENHVPQAWSFPSYMHQELCYTTLRQRDSEQQQE